MLSLEQLTLRLNHRRSHRHNVQNHKAREQMVACSLVTKELLGNKSCRAES